MEMVQDKVWVPMEEFFEPHLVQPEDSRATYARRRQLRKERRQARLEQARTRTKSRRVILSCLVCGAAMSVKVDREKPTMECPHCGREQDVSVFLGRSR